MMTERNQRSELVLLAIVAAIVSVALSGCAFVSINLFRAAEPLQEKVVEGEGPGKVLLMDISGLLAYEKEEKRGDLRESINLIARVKEELRKAAEDPEIRGLILRIHSPGGTVHASDLLHHELKEFKEQREVAVVACLLGVATSGGYYVATAADHIIAQPTTLTGSIGTIAFKFNIQGLMMKVGVEEETVKSGDKKDIGSPFRPATPQELEIFQAIIDDYQNRFLEVVREGRKELTESDLATIGDGRILSGQQALDLNLVDELGYLTDAVEWARKALGMPQAKVVAYFRPGTYMENIYSVSQGEAWGWVERMRRGAVFSQGSEPQFMYLWAP